MAQSHALLGTDEVFSSLTIVMIATWNQLQILYGSMTCPNRLFPLEPIPSKIYRV